MKISLYEPVISFSSPVFSFAPQKKWMDRPRLKRRSHNIKENWNVLNRTKNPRSLAGKAPIFSHFLHLASSLNYFCLESKFRKEKVFFWMRTLLFCSLINPGSEQKITALNLFCLQKQWHKSYLPLKKFLETQFHFMLKFNLLYVRERRGKCLGIIYEL